MSAIAEQGDKNEPIQVLITLHPNFDTLDFCGPVEVLRTALHDNKNPATKAFEVTTVASTDHVTSSQGVSIKVDIDFEEAHDRLSEFDVLIVPGGGTEPILKSNSEPLPLISAYAELQKKDPSHERTLFSVCTGSLFLAQQGVLQGLAATTHPDFYTKLEILCRDATLRNPEGLGERTDVMEERYVVNNARFDLGPDIDENPFVSPTKPDGRRKSNARKGSDAWKMSRRRESLARRANMRLGGMRVITGGGISSGIDAALYLVAALVSHESALEVARVMQYTWKKGVTVEGIDV